MCAAKAAKMTFGFWGFGGNENPPDGAVGFVRVERKRCAVNLGQRNSQRKRWIKKTLA